MASDRPPLAWGVVGPGAIAEVFAASVTEAGVGRIAAAYGRDAARRAAYCARFGGRAAASLEELCARPDVQAVYVATPHVAHAEAVRAALDAGKAVLCEKPLAPGARQTADLHMRAQERGLLLVEGWMYRHHPQVEEAYRRVASGEIGEPRGFRAWFGFAAPYDAAHRLWNPALGGGAILDVGGYPLSLLLRLSTCETPELVEARAVRAPSGVDQDASARWRFRPGDGLMMKDAAIETRVSLVEELGRGAVVEGTEGRLVFVDPFLPGGARRGTRAELRLERAGAAPETVVVDAGLDCFALQARSFARALARGETDAPWPLVGFCESLDLAALLEEWGGGC